MSDDHIWPNTRPVRKPRAPKRRLSAAARRAIYGQLTGAQLARRVAEALGTPHSIPPPATPQPKE